MIHRRQLFCGYTVLLTWGEHKFESLKNAMLRLPMVPIINTKLRSFEAAEEAFPDLLTHKLM
jgi:hypothetical protein